MKARPIAAIAVVQLFLWAAHWFMVATWEAFWWPLTWHARLALEIAMAVLATIFVPASFLSYRSDNLLVRGFYRLAAIWIGIANFLFIAAWVAWLADLVMRFTAQPDARIIDRRYVASALLLTAIVVAMYGFINARVIRTRRISIELPNLPQCWRGRQALLISDMHLGHINREGFARRVAASARELNPAIIFIAGDLFDGSKVDAQRIVRPLFDLKPPLGIFFVGGNHEEFGDAAQFESALSANGFRVLHNECVTRDGMNIVGIPYGPDSYPLHMRAYLESLRLKDGEASILLNHVPNRLPIAEHAGVNLQLSGHTHGGGQIFPFNFITRRAFGKFTYGLQRFGEMQVYTSSGVGTWGPPMRVGTHSEIVLLTFA